MGKAIEQTIYLDHAATTPLDEEVFVDMYPYFCQVYGNADSVHESGRRAMRVIDMARDNVAELLGAKPSEIFFTSGGTESDNWAILGGAYAGKTQGKTHVLLSAIEHHAALYAGERLQKEGFEVEYIPVDKTGKVQTETLQKMLRPTTALVGVMSANNETGTLQPIAELARLTKENGSLFFTDAVQLAPYAPINVKALGVDLLSLSSHKFYGPKGCGVLYIKSGVKIEKLIGGGDQQKGLRGGTLNVPAIVGFSSAYRKNAEGMYETNAKLASYRETFLKGISTLDGVHINGDKEGGLPAILNLRIDGVQNTALLYAMDLQGVQFSAGAACAASSVKPSHVLKGMGLTDEEAKNSVRISFGKSNTAEQIETAAKKFVQTVRKLRAK